MRIMIARAIAMINARLRIVFWPRATLSMRDVVVFTTTHTSSKGLDYGSRCPGTTRTHRNENTVISICETLEHDCTVSRVRPDHRDNPIANPLYAYMYMYTRIMYTKPFVLIFYSWPLRHEVHYFNHSNGVQILKYTTCDSIGHVRTVVCFREHWTEDVKCSYNTISIWILSASLERPSPADMYINIMANVRSVAGRPKHSFPETRRQLIFRS
jgi:hypothetical protein